MTTDGPIEVVGWVDHAGGHATIYQLLSEVEGIFVVGGKGADGFEEVSVGGNTFEESQCRSTAFWREGITPTACAFRVRSMKVQMDRATATALIDQLCRDLPRGDSPAAIDFDYGWFRERVASVADQCSGVDVLYVWQYAMWYLDAAGLM